MKILALDTATEACSAALLIDGSIRERFEIAPRAHARLLLPMLDDLLKEAGLAPAQLDAIAFGRGPGSFTGVRIAASVAQGIAFAADLPVLPVSTLAALAWPVLRDGADRVFAAIDARMGEIYWAAYAGSAQNGLEALSEEQVTSAAVVCVPAGDAWQGVGSGWAVYADVLRPHFGACLLGFDATALPHAADIAGLAALDFAQGRAVTAEQALPVYLRNQVVQTQRR
ncbi:MAG TPA: tRNA (adenosine(37)-N6)-threonylcarbamoyltransferase complex dimerization subunit type 1 TsaB [Thiobacillus sp.]